MNYHVKTFDIYNVLIHNMIIYHVIDELFSRDNLKHDKLSNDNLFIECTNLFNWCDPNLHQYVWYLTN